MCESSFMLENNMTEVRLGGEILDSDVSMRKAFTKSDGIILSNLYAHIVHQCNCNVLHHILSCKLSVIIQFLLLNFFSLEFLSLLLFKLVSSFALCHKF